VWLALATVVVVTVAGTGAAYGFDRSRAQHLLPGTTIGGVDVGELDDVSAVERLRASIEAPLRRPLHVRAPGLDRETSAWALGLRMDVADAVRETLTSQREANLAERVWRRLRGVGDDVVLDPDLDRAVLRAFVDEAASAIEQPVADARLDVVDGWVQVTPALVGRTLDAAGAERALRAAIAEGASEATLPVAEVLPEVPTERFASVLLVRTVENRLYHYRDGRIEKQYRVATGMPGYRTPTGIWRITAKRRNPAWGNPGSAWAAGMPRYIAPGRNNPLGTRAMNLSARGIRIHGTPASSSIGTHASHGCIRMLMWEAEELFELVEVDTPVVIVRA
jgi:lipoprotein-anchoring transpeptidase ErfK/SrfK